MIDNMGSIWALFDRAYWEIHNKLKIPISGKL
jgi:hypothetical protein